MTALRRHTDLADLSYLPEPIFRGGRRPYSDNLIARIEGAVQLLGDVDLELDQLDRLERVIQVAHVRNLLALDGQMEET